MKAISKTALVAALCLGLLGSRAAQTPERSFPEAAALPPQAGLPDPLVMIDGRRVSTQAQWVEERRPELKALFEHYMYGALPPKPASLQAKLTGEYRDFLDGQATLRLVTLEIGPGDGPRIDLMLVLPNARSGPAPVFLAMDFAGNHALTRDARVPVARTAAASTRGAEASNWPLGEIVRRGYGLAAFFSSDVDPDRKEVSQGLYAWLAAGDPARNNSTNRGTITAWAWGFSRCVDYLVTEREVDVRRIAALGHSRNGKAALLAAAFDERIAIAFPHQAGCGGSAPSRGKVGESVKVINGNFPHWFNAQFKQFNDAPERLPFDQNGLVALCAPRPLLFSAAEGDQWANPAGQFEVLEGADAVYRFLGVEGLAAKEKPPLRQLVDSRLGYYIREGKHSMTADDWRVFMDFADKHWPRK
jgi:hypothetical protein